MNLLLDTHVLLWWLDETSALSAEARDAIANPANRVFVSAATAGEIAIKKALGKLSAPDNLVEEMALHRFEPLAVTIEHALGVESLPRLHRDPFDRLLVAQARTERITLVTRDRDIEQYGVPCIRA